MEVKFLLFAAARDIAGCPELSLPLKSSATVADALQELIVRFPLLHQWKDVVRIAVNQQYAPMEMPLHQGDEIAVIPPVSGG